MLQVPQTPRVPDPPSLGAHGEDLAAEWYSARGFYVLARNWRCRVGEIDLIVGLGDLLVFCEVKTRSSDRFGAGWEAVTARKQAKLRSLAGVFLSTEPALRGARVRFDVASVAIASGLRPTVEVFEDAF